MSCNRNAQVEAWYDGELSPSERESVERHLGQCAERAQLVAELRQTSQMLGGAPCALMGGDALRRLEQAWWAAQDRGVLRLAEWLTAAAAAVLIGALFFWSDNDYRPNQASTQVIGWQADAVMPPAESREEPAADVVVLAEWMANDLSPETNR